MREVGSCQAKISHDWRLTDGLIRWPSFLFSSLSLFICFSWTIEKLKKIRFHFHITQVKEVSTGRVPIHAGTVLVECSAMGMFFPSTDSYHWYSWFYASAETHSRMALQRMFQTSTNSIVVSRTEWVLMLSVEATWNVYRWVDHTLSGGAIIWG